ncbi:MICROSOMAL PROSTAGLANDIN E SYNTHASE-2 [Salix purpurea]|uniref:MICROSOMAL PROSTAGLANDIN E SYNTHASE-2 n=1 Tax=Salix purpurea TaxID=77065 RepID=A0A9Q0USG6_SALPP|nr:MICROSOMAL PROSTAGLANDIN E SYNTHASE-2 [Salix purpurea]
MQVILALQKESQSSMLELLQCIFVSKNLKKKYNITDERAALYEAVETWVDALNGREFLDIFMLFLYDSGGSKPNLADLAVFGGIETHPLFEVW